MIIKYFIPKYFVIEHHQTGLLKNQEFMDKFDFKDVDDCKYGMPYRKRTRLWNNITTWKPRDLCKKDCGKIRNNKQIETAQRLPSGTKEKWSEHHIKHKQGDLYKIPSELICEILVSLTDQGFRFGVCSFVPSPKKQGNLPLIFVCLLLICVCLPLICVCLPLICVGAFDGT